MGIEDTIHSAVANRSDTLSTVSSYHYHHLHIIRVMCEPIIILARWTEVHLVKDLHVKTEFILIRYKSKKKKKKYHTKPPSTKISTFHCKYPVTTEKQSCYNCLT